MYQKKNNLKDWKKKEAEAQAQEGCLQNLMIKRSRESQRRVGMQSGEFVVQGSSQFAWQLIAKVASDWINLSIKKFWWTSLLCHINNLIRESLSTETPNYVLEKETSSNLTFTLTEMLYVKVLQQQKCYGTDWRTEITFSKLMYFY